MLLGAALSAVALFLLTAVGVPRLAVAGFAVRAPWAALVLWQSVGLTGALLLLETAATVALAPLGRTHLQAFDVVTAAGRRPAIPWWALSAAVLGVAVSGRLVGVLLGSTLRTVRARRRNRVLVDLVATRNPLLRGTHVLDHDVPVAYCLPGLRPRVVFSRGALTTLAEREVRAVLDHELAHVVQRHDLVALPFVVLGRTFPRVAAVRLAQQQVGLLIEMLADDRATRRHDPLALARALYKVGAGKAPAGGLGVGGLGVGGPGLGGMSVGGPGSGGLEAEVLLRVRRLLVRPDPIGPAGLSAILGTALGVLLLPVLGVLLPL